MAVADDGCAVMAARHRAGSARCRLDRPLPNSCSACIWSLDCERVPKFPEWSAVRPVIDAAARRWQNIVTAARQIKQCWITGERACVNAKACPRCRAEDVDCGIPLCDQLADGRPGVRGYARVAAARSVTSPRLRYDETWWSGFLSHRSWAGCRQACACRRR